jgi:hypothetical protein
MLTQSQTSIQHPAMPIKVTYRAEIVSTLSETYLACIGSAPTVTSVSSASSTTARCPAVVNMYVNRYTGMAYFVQRK